MISVPKGKPHVFGPEMVGASADWVTGFEPTELWGLDGQRRSVTNCLEDTREERLEQA